MVNHMLYYTHKVEKTHLAHNKRRINTMATNELIAKLNELSELRRMAEELNAEIEGVLMIFSARLFSAVPSARMPPLNVILNTAMTHLIRRHTHGIDTT